MQDKLDLKSAAGSLHDRFARLDPERRAYMLQTLALHLRDAGQYRRLYALIDKPWMELKREQTASRRAFAQDVEVALQAAEAEQPPQVVQEVRCSLIYATLGKLATSSPPRALAVLAYAGQVEAARGLAALMQDRARQVEAYLEMAEAMGAGEHTAEAQSVRSELPALARSIEDRSVRTAFITRVSYAFAQQGDPLQALSVARSIEDLWHKATTLSYVAQVLAETGQGQVAARAAAEALQAAEAVPLEGHLTWTSPGTTATMGVSDPSQGFALAQADALGDAAVALALTGQIDGARAAVAGIRAGRHDVAELVRWRKAKALADLAGVLARRGQHKLAVDLADQAQGLAARLASGRRKRGEDRERLALYQGSAMAAAAGAYADAGRAEPAGKAARRALQELEEVAGLGVEVECGPLHLTITGSAALRQAILVLAETGEYGLAQLAAAWIQDGWVYLEALIDLAEMLLQAGEEDLAREVLDQVETGLDEATAQAQTLRGGRNRLLALDQVALLWQRLGAADRAREVVEEALTEAGLVSSRADRAQAMSELAQTLALCGAEARAVEVAHRAIALTEDVGDQPARVAALASMAQALGNTGRVEEGRKVALQALAQVRRLKGNQDRSLVLSRAALALAATGAPAEAARIARQAADAGRALRRPAYRAQALTEAGLALAAAGLATEAVAAADDVQAAIPGIRRVADRSQALGRLALVWAAAGENSAAREASAEAVSASTSILRGQKVDVLCLAALATYQAGDQRQARSTAARALDTAKAIGEPVARAEALSQASWALLQVGETGWALEIARSVVAAPESLAALSRAGRTLAKAEQVEEAILAWRRALRWARQAGRAQVLSVLDDGASALAALDKGETAWQTFQAIQEVENWWE